MLARCLNIVFALQGLRYNTTVIIGQRLEAARRDWQQLSAAHQQLNFTLTQMQQKNDRLHTRRFQLELEEATVFGGSWISRRRFITSRRMPMLTRSRD
jgi:hypothetical protein